MNDHLRRLVARHAVPARLRPRSVSRFEDGLDGAAVTLQDETTVNAPAATARSAAFGTEDASAATPATPTLPGPHRAIGGGRTASGQAMTDPLPAPAAVRSAPAAAMAQPAPMDRAEDERSTLAPPATAPHRVRANAAPAIEHPGRRVSVTGRLPAWPAVVPRRSIAPIEPEAVHVHIGRVEVRAVVAGDAPKPRAPVPVRPAPLSLGDYLGAERRA